MEQDIKSEYIELDGEAYNNYQTMPEKKLLLAVLSKSIDDLCSPDENLRGDAEEWVFADQDEEKFEIFSFEHICSILDYNYIELKKVLLRYTNC